MNIIAKFLTIALLLGAGSMALAQKANQEEKKPVYQFTETVSVPHSPVDNQGSSGTCWCFAGIGFVEAEIMRMYGKEFNLSEMFTVRNAWAEKVAKFVRMHGNSTLSQGGEVCDVLYMIDKYGMMPEADYSGKVIGETRHMHSEMNEVISGVARAVIKNGNKKISPVYPKAIEGVLDAYLGEVPEDFTVDGKKYTAKSFAEAYPINPDNYIEICSFTTEPNYKPCMVEIPDNWTWTPAYNMPLDDLMAALDYALVHGYTVGWAQDVSNAGFSRKEGVGIVPEDPKDPKLWEEIVAEKQISDADHQTAYDNWETGDDHSMLVVGIANDQNGNKYYKIKNSWGPAGPNEGYWYCSESYVRLYTVFFTLNKEALSKAMRGKLKL